MTNVKHMQLAQRIIKIMKNYPLKVAIDKISKLKYPNSNVKIGYEDAGEYYTNLASEIVTYDISKPYSGDVNAKKICTNISKANKYSKKKKKKRKSSSK